MPTKESSPFIEAMSTPQESTPKTVAADLSYNAQEKIIMTLGLLIFLMLCVVIIQNSRTNKFLERWEMKIV
jgi:uncharacterized integral membrane protein